MAISQSDYVRFYYDVRKRIADIIEEKEGRAIVWTDPQTDVGGSRNAMERPFSPMTNNSPNIHKSTVVSPQNEPISLNELLYGDFIDSKYKELFKIYCTSDGYVKNQMSGFIHRVAMDIYDTYFSKKALDRILDKVRTSSYDCLTKEEKAILFSSKK